MKPPIQSLRWRLIISIILSVSTILGLGGWAAYRSIARELYAELDRSLEGRARAIISMVETEAGFVDFEWMESGAKHPPGFTEGEEALQLWSQDDRVLSKTPFLDQAHLPRWSRPDHPVFRSLLVQESAWRGVGWRFTAASDPEAQEDMDGEEIAALMAAGYLRLEEPAVMDITLARLDRVSPFLSQLRKLFLLVWGAVSLATAALVWLIVRQNLYPLTTLQRQIGALTSASPNQQIHLKNPPVELKPVVDELNGLLNRVEDALRRERNLTSNVAHELRTPIAGLLSTLEVTLSRERDADEYQEASTDCLEIAKRMHWLVNNLLSIARVDAGNVELHDHIVELKSSFQDWWGPFVDSAAAKQLTVTWNIDDCARVETDPEFLRVVVSNLFDNAVSYTQPGGTILVQATNEVITIGNDVVDLSPELAQRVFEPFWRSKESREDVGVHAGLGLSLCQKIIHILGGRIDVALTDPGNVFEVTLRFAD